GRGWDQAKLIEHRNPTRWDLDEAAPDNPVFLIRTCGHVVVVNSKALEISGIDKNTPQPIGGTIVKDEHGEPTGLLLEQPAFILVKKKIPPPDFERKIEAIKMASQAFSEAGLTSVIEAGITEEEMRAYQIAQQRGFLTVRVNMMLRGVAEDESEEESLRRIRNFPMTTGFGNDMIRFLGLKLLIDGGIGGRTALLREPYENEENCGILTMPEDKLQRLVDAANIKGMNVGIHCAGGGAMDIVLKTFENTDKINPIKGRRFSIIHAYQPSEENFEQCRRFGVCVASQPSFLYYLGDSYYENVGAKRSEWLKPHRAWIDNGILVAAGTDSPVTPYLPFPSLWTSIARRTEVKGTPLGVDQKITREEAIRMYTLNGAYLALREDEVGSIEQGKLADLVVLDRDILKCLEDEIKDTKIVKTILGGKTVYSS
ncbi:amidohydrolase, partial [Candidatus Bathyarchaeota archaeon]|nr:amidohydrolase [Candidatus Bathyarchaeota archaeon]